jgi:hypothetical protein
MQVAFATQPAADGALNEDFIAVTTQLVILLDGASVPEGLETGCRHGTAWYVARLGTRLLEELAAQPSQLPTDALAAAIHGVASLHADTCELDHPGAPSAALALLRKRTRPSIIWSWPTPLSCSTRRATSLWSAMTALLRSPSLSIRPCTERQPGP